jgi:hypothetical protein
MAVTRLKPLKRKKIDQRHIAIRLESHGKAKKQFTAQLDLAEYKLPPDARVYLDAKQLMETIRFDFGTVASLKPNITHDISRLKGDRVTFAINVIQTSNAQKLASAEAIRPQNERVNEGGAIALLPVDASQDLNGLLWTISYEGDDGDGHSDAPVLALDKRATGGAASTFLQNSVVRGLVLPAAMREILTKVVIMDKHHYEPSSISWRDSWVRFAGRHTGGVPGADDSTEEWTQFIKDATEAFARNASLLDTFLTERDRS